MVAPAGRYSKYIRPISISFDLLVISFLSFYFFRNLGLNYLVYGIYQLIAWGFVAFFSKFYEVYRFTTPVEIITKLVKQGVLFLLVVIAFFPFDKSAIFSGSVIAVYMICSFVLISGFKYILFYYLRKYRLVTGSNYRNAVIIGYTPEAIKLKELFETRNDFGYRFLGYFSDKKSNANITGKVDQIKDFVLANKVDEIYCSLNEISNEQLKDLVEFTDEYRKTIKFIPDSKEIFSKNLKIDYYEFFPVLSLQRTLLHDPITKVFKRVFDIVFSLCVLVFLLSWLVRPGIQEKEFYCFKFRSMKINKTTEQEASKNDPRVTKIGRFIRKTSIDEMPQFLNVLLGDMSVVGPRPHLWSQNKAYGNKIKKYMVRHYVKPGITGLAQVRGFRGEIKNDEDMINRIKYDVFYIENWSLILDLKIIVQTVINIFKGEEKAY
jgi:putative colanic acid biosynthesis UDP-glucose lipid carrier transferase